VAFSVFFLAGIRLDRGVSVLAFCGEFGDTFICGPEVFGKIENDREAFGDDDVPADNLALFELKIFELERDDEPGSLDSPEGLRGALGSDGMGDGAFEEPAFEESEGVALRDRGLGYAVLPLAARRPGGFSGDGESPVRSI
jgi:hypothetical protein